VKSSHPKTSISALARREPGAIARAWIKAKRSRATRRAYFSDLVSIGSFILGRSCTHDESIAAVAGTDLDAIATWRDDAIQHEAPATVARRLAALRTFYRFLVGQEVRRDNPAEHVEAPIVASEEQRRPHLEDHQVRALLAAARAQSGDPLRALRNRALVLLLASAGLRIAEALGLRPSDFNADASTIRIRSATAKRGKPRILEVSKRLAADLTILRSTIDADERFVPITRERVRQLLIRWASLAGIPDHLVTPHALRRTFGTLAIDRGIPIEALRRAMGHEDPRTTARYDRRRQASAIVEYE
jgi:site-specific recombinase XerD